MDEAANNPKEPAVAPPPDVNPRPEPVLDFTEKPLAEMSPGDYEALGFMSGLEVHQQLRTRSKLFCRCPAGRRVTRVDAEVLRHMRPTLSELGEYDGTALMEFKTKKEIVYLLERGTVCTYEMDDTPPFHIDDEAVRIAVEIAELCSLNLVSELHVMRKQYLDGSIPTGFQRTAMVGLTGAIPFRVPGLAVRRDLSIRQLSLEEDSCREVSDVGHRITFRTDRLGMPLTEVVTEPELLTPWELQAAGHLIARLARSTGKVLRGPGAGRQDVNVSVAGGRRVEIKGVHHHRGLPLLVHTEAFRQLNLLRVRAELERRGVAAGALTLPDGGRPWEGSPLVVDARHVLRHSSFQPVRQAIHDGEFAVAVRLPGFSGILAHPTQPGVTFAREIADRVRVIACPIRQPFMTHSDLGVESLEGYHWSQLGKALGADHGDAIIVVWAPEADAATAAREVLIRAREALVGIPAETRQAYPDGTTGFERILPGADRMYPDTDTPPLPIPDRTIAEIRARMREAPWAREERYEAMGLTPRMARHLAGAPWADLYDEIAPEPGELARRLAGAMEKRIPYHARLGGRPRRPDWGRGPGDLVPPLDRVAPIVRAVEEGKIRTEALTMALDDALRDPGRPVSEIVAGYRPLQEGSAAVAKLVKKAVKGAGTMEGRTPGTLLRWSMGEVMGELRGRVGPGVVQEMLARALGVRDEEEAS